MPEDLYIFHWTQEMKIDRYGKSGKKMSTKVDVSDAVWGVPMNEDLVGQAIYVYSHNQRKGTAHAKTRSEVRGGGKKPWMQKGTGRARHGSIRSPIWVGGGVAFGPIPYKRMKKLPNKMQRAALTCVLSDRAASDNVRFMSDMAGISTGKTKDIVSLIETLGLGKDRVLIIVSNDEQGEILKGVRNVPNVTVRSALDVNVYDAARNDTVIVGQEGAALLEKRLT
jgi:large subunit ribosomal protein L4